MSSAESSASESSSDDEGVSPPLPPAASNGVDFDLGLLAAFVANDSTMHDDVAASVQTVVDALFALPPGKEGLRRVVALPAPVTRLPRQKPLPKPKAETKWEAFAKSKGIGKTKRERMVYDEHAQDWRPRFGAQRSQSHDPPILELKQTDSADANPFERDRTAKKLRTLKQQARTLKNKERASAQQQSNAGGFEGDVLDPAQKLGKKRTHAKLKVAQVATASYGRFDRDHKGEPKREIGDKRRQFASNLSSAADERARNLKLLQRL